MGVQVIPMHSHWGGFPFPFLFYSHSHGIPGPTGNPIPMHISTLNAARLSSAGGVRADTSVGKE